jgi:uncharacterized integral membrane protein
MSTTRTTTICGLAAIAIAAVGIWWVRWQEKPVLHDPAGLGFLGLMLLGWVLVGFAVAQRTAYHRRRMAGK